MKRTINLLNRIKSIKSIKYKKLQNSIKKIKIPYVQIKISC